MVLRVDPGAELGLQHQICQQLIDAILSGVLSSGRRLPSSRQMARQLGVARNTVVLACQQLVAQGHLIARQRSGLYVNDEMVRGLAMAQRTERPSGDERDFDWHGRLKATRVAEQTYRYPPDWQKYPFPFVEGRFDSALYPIKEWREATRLALGARQFNDWSSDAGDADDDALIRQICEKVLPRRGIRARQDQVLLTGGREETLALLVELFAAAGTRVAVEEPGNAAFRDLLHRRGAALEPRPVDEGGLIVDDALDGCDLVYVTPSHQQPTAVTMMMERRTALLDKARAAGFIVIEDDFECETNYLDDAFPALRGLPGGERVIHVGALSRALAPGLRLGFIAADASVIQEARALRAMIARPPPLGAQRIAALFLSLGHYDRTMLKLGRAFRARMAALRDALNHYLPQSIAVAPVRGGTTFWVRGPDGLDARDLARAAEARGILIEPVNHHYAGAAAPKNVFRMSVTGIDAGRIRDGVAALAALMREMSAAKLVWLDPEEGTWLSAAELKRVLPGSTFLYKTVYGEPCTIELLRQGRMRGRAGYANEDRDSGRWWIEDGMWCRQWENWAYGEVSRYRTRIQNGRIEWFNAEGRLVDSAIFVPTSDRAR